MKLHVEKRVFEFSGNPLAAVAYDIMMQPDASVSAAGQKHLLVLVNGYGRNRLDFRAFRRRVHSEFPELISVAIDNRGCGETVTREPFTLVDMANDVLSIAERVCNEFQMREFALLGISMGGMIAQHAAARSSKVSKLVLVSTTPGGKWRVWPSDVLSEMENSRDQTTGQVQLPKFRGLPQDLAGMKTRMTRFFGSKFVASSPLLIDAMAKTILNAAQVEGSETQSRLQHAASVGFDGTELLKDIRCPVLVVTGDQDAVIPPSNSDILVQQLSDAKLVVYPEVGHLILIEEPEIFAHDVLDFLRSSDDRNGRVFEKERPSHD